MGDLTVKRIKNYYTGDGCIQTSISFLDNLSISEEYTHNCIFNYDPKGFYINNYVHDSRRFVFPYHNIPIYKSKHNKHVLVLLDFDKLYVIKRNRDYNEYVKVLRFGKEAIMLCSDDSNHMAFNMTSLELRGLFNLEDDIDNNIDYRYNPGVSKEEIKHEKKLIKQLKRR